MINPIFEKQQLASLFEKLNKAENILIFGHKSPDGDSIGSTLGLYHFLKNKGIKSQVIQPDNFPNFLKWMPENESMLIFDKNKKEVKDQIKNADVIFTLDFNDQTRVGNELGQLISNATCTKVMLDHHQEPKDYASYTFSDVKASSTCQLVYELIEANGDLELIDEKVGNCIYTGLLTDTGSFRFPATTPKTHRIAADLIERGVNHSHIHEYIQDINTPDRLRLLGYTLNNKLEVLPEIKTAIVSLTMQEMKDHKTLKGYTEGFVNMALSIIGIEVAVFVKEDEKIVKLSFRSKGDIPVNEFSKAYFGGGGHINAAGGASQLSVEETIDKIKKELPAFLDQNK